MVTKCSFCHNYSGAPNQKILNSAIKAFEKIVEEDRNNIKPLYRNRFWKQKERESIKQNKKCNWYQKSESVNYKTVCFGPSKPGRTLLKKLKEREGELNKNGSDRIKFVEKGGLKYNI